MKLGAVILAAGEASRFGEPKQLLEIDGQTLVQRACRLAVSAGASSTVVVWGAYQEVMFETDSGKIIFVENPKWREGMGSSLARGMSELINCKLDAVLILLVDQPGINEQTIKRLIEALSSLEISIVRCQSEKNVGPPAIFAAKHFASLSQLEGEQGGRQLLKQYAAEVTTIWAPEAVWDIDEIEIWQKFSKVFC